MLHLMNRDERTCNLFTWGYTCSCDSSYQTKSYLFHVSQNFFFSPLFFFLNSLIFSSRLICKCMILMCVDTCSLTFTTWIDKCFPSMSFLCFFSTVKTNNKKSWLVFKRKRKCSSWKWNDEAFTFRMFKIFTW